MLESAGSTKPRDTLLEKLRERIKERDRALEVKHTQTHTHTGERALNTAHGLINYKTLMLMW